MIWPDDLPQTADELLETGLLNQWYLVCRDTDLGTGPLGLKRLDRNIVLWRDKAGKVRALDDFCPHRGARLSLGHVCDDDIACAYHGVQLDCDGMVTATPPTPKSSLVGQKLGVSYPCEEVHGGIWVYFHDRLEHSVTPPPLQFPEEFSTGEWSGFLDIRHWECNWQLVRDNQFDPIHGSFLHVGTHILSGGKKDADMGFERTELGFVVWRKNQQGVNLDKTWLNYFPGSGFWAITDLPYPRREGGGLGRLFRFPTPIDATHTMVWNYRMQKMSGWKRDIWRFIYKTKGVGRGLTVLSQDCVALEAIPKDAAKHESLMQCDIGVAHIRRLYKEEAERQIRARKMAVAAE